MAFLDDDDDVEHVVSKWAEALQLSTALPRRALDALRAMKSLRYIKDYVVYPDDLLPNAKGQFDSASQIILLQDTTSTAAETMTPWAQWVVFEEIGHAALKHSGVRNFSEAKTATEKFSPTAKRQEAEARRFAATMMAPYDLVGYRPDMTVDELIRLSGLPRRAAEFRLNELGRIHRRRTGVRREIPTAVLDFLAKPTRPRSPYEGDPCPNPNCGKLAMVREGTKTRCTSCGTCTGED